MEGKEGMKMKDSFKKSGYTYLKFLGNGEHLLKNEDGIMEVWFNNKNHASYGLTYKNTYLEFARQQKVQSWCGMNDCELCRE